MRRLPLILATLVVLALVGGGALLASGRVPWDVVADTAPAASPSPALASPVTPVPSDASATPGTTPSASPAVSPTPSSVATPSAPTPSTPSAAPSPPMPSPSAAIPSPSPVAPASTLGSRPVDLPAFDAAVQAWRKKTGTPGVAAAIVFPDGRIWTGSFGTADSSTGRPVTDDTAFAFASVSKTFTAAVILQLVQEGKIGLDDRVATLLPEAKLDQRMTLRELLDHTSGLPDFFRVAGIDPALNRDQHRVWTAEDALAFGRRDRVPPETFWRYSNTGYVYLGQIAERLTGRPWSSLVRERLLDPLGLSSVFIQGVERPTGPLARGHKVTGGPTVWRATPLGGRDPLTPFTSVVTAAGAAGAVAGDAADAARWTAALYGGDVLEPEMLAAAVADSARTAVFRPRIAYGLGVQVVRYGTVVTWGHSGSFVGFKNQIRWLPTQRIAIALLTDQSRVETGTLMKQLVAMAVAVPPDPVDTCPLCR